MADPLFDEALTLQTAGVSDTGAILAVALEDEKTEARVRHSHLLLTAGNEWRRVASLDFLCVRVTWEPSTRQWIALGETGAIVTVGDSPVVNTEWLSPNRQPGSFGLMRSLRLVDHTLYAVGMRRQVFAKRPGEGWSEVGSALKAKDAAGPVMGFESVDGFGDEVYAVGWEGEIALRGNDTWELLDAPTNRILTGVACASSGVVYACGQRGTLLVGRRSEWTNIEASGVSEDLWDLAWYKEHLYSASLRSVYILEQEKLVRVDMEDATTTSCYHLSVAGDFLCSVGAQAIGIFDGEEWRAIPLP